MNKEKHSGYAPPFTVSSRAISLVAEISAQIERYAIRMEQADGLRLRKANKIRTIHSSLAIEGNRLSENQVHDILEGKHVVAPLREIQEVKNAIRTYELYASLNPFDMKDLLKAHGVMMEDLVDNPGCFRSSGVGVFEGDRCVHLAPPPMCVPELMEDLFYWLKHAPTIFLSVVAFFIMNLSSSIRSVTGMGGWGGCGSLSYWDVSTRYSSISLSRIRYMPTSSCTTRR